MTPMSEVAPVGCAVPRRPRLLVVDSDVRTARVLAELLALDGFAVDVADGEAAALRVADGPLPEALIVNVTTPPIDGLRVTRLARARDPSLPVLLITAYPHLGMRWGPTQGPPPVVYAKPLDYARLVATLSGLSWGPEAPQA